MAVQRAASEAFAGTLNEQPSASALFAGLPAANAALVALMQNTSSAAAAISMISLMTVPPEGSRHRVHELPCTSRAAGLDYRKNPARSLHKLSASHCTTGPRNPAGFDPVATG